MRTQRTTIGRKIVRLGEALGMTQEAMASALGVERGTVSSYKARDNANPSMDKVDDFVKAVSKSHFLNPQRVFEWVVDGEDTDPDVGNFRLLGRQTDTSSGYSISVDTSDNSTWNIVIEAAEAFTSPRIARVKVPIVNGSEIWGVKGARTYEMNVPGFAIAGGRMLVRISGDSLGAHRRNQVIGFEPDEYPYVGPYLLCSSRDDEAVCTIRYIDPDVSPSTLISPDDNILPVPLNEWDVLGFAVMEISPRPGDRTIPEVHFAPQGFGPKGSL